MFTDPVTVINNRMSTDSIGSEFSLDDSGKCDNRMPQSHSLHDVCTLNSEPMSEDDEDDDDDNDNALLEQCINAGIENITTSNIIDDEELPDDVQEELLSRCIAAGIKMPTTCKSQMPVKIKTKKQDVNNITEKKQRQELLESEIKNNKKSFKNKCDDLSDSEQEEALLKECIAAGMRKLQKNKSKELNDDTLELNEDNLLNNCCQGVQNVLRKQREIPVLNKYKKSFAPKSDSEFSESTSTMTPGGVVNGIKKLDESNDSTWKDDETLTFSTLTSSYQSANTGENSKPKLIQLDKGEIGNYTYLY